MCFHTSVVETPIAKIRIWIFILAPCDLVANKVMCRATRFCIFAGTGNGGWAAFPELEQTWGIVAFPFELSLHLLRCTRRNPSIWEAKVGRLQVWDPLRVHNEFSGQIWAVLWSPVPASFLHRSPLVFKMRVLSLLLSGPIITTYFDSLSFYICLAFWSWSAEFLASSLAVSTVTWNFPFAED